jgi:transposase
MLAAYAQAMAPARTPARDPAREALTDLHRRRDQLVEARAGERVRLKESATDPAGSLQSHIAWLDAEIVRFAA